MQLACDLPIERDGIFVHNELVLSGWALSAVGVSGVIVQIDDQFFHASYRLDTPWLAESMPDVEGADRAGYQLRIDTSAWSPGRREITITAHDQDGGRGDISGTVDIVPFGPPSYSTEDNRAAIEAGEIAMWLERPSPASPGPEAESPVEIAGWAYSKGGVETVLVTIDGRTRAEALQPVFRPDLVDDFGEEVARAAGFVLRLDGRECPPGWHHLSVVATAGDRPAVGIELDFHCLPEPPPEQPPAPGEAMPVDWRPASDPVPRLRAPEEDATLGGEPFRAAEQELRRQLVAQLESERATLVVESAAELPNAHDDASFDLAICFDALAQADDPGATLDELRRVLRPDGVLLVGLPRHAPTLAGGLEGALRERFASVRVLRQRTLLASAIADDATLASEGVLDIELRKIGQARPGGEDHLLALAGDGELPELRPVALLAPPGAVQRARGTIAMWQDRALLAEADAAASRNQANLANMHQEATLRELRDAERELAARGAALTEARAEFARASTGLTETRAELDERAAELAQSETRLEQASARLEQASAQLERQADELAAAERRAEAAEAAAAAQQRSLSWRVTRPLRAVKRGALRTRDALRRIG
jgi:SAM-dependent methyltransferase